MPGRVAHYVRRHGADPWVLRGPTGICVRVNILHRATGRHTKLGKGWRKFCQLHDVVPGDRIRMRFTDGVARVIDVEFDR